MARINLLAMTMAAVGGRRHLVDQWATPPSVFNWQEPLGQDSNFLHWSSWPRDTKNQVLFLVSFVGFILFFLGFCCLLRCHNKGVERDTSRFAPGAWTNDDDGVSAPPPWQQQEQQPPASEDDHAPRSNSGEGDEPPRRQRRRRRQQQPSTVAEVPAADVESVLGEVHLTEAGVEWVLANFPLPAPVADMEMAPAADVEMPTAPEPAPTLKCTFSTAEGWAEGTCCVCLSELVDGNKVRVLTACMHCFHATCVETWLRKSATCPLCRAPTMAIPARGRRRRRPADPNLSRA